MFKEVVWLDMDEIGGKVPNIFSIINNTYLENMTNSLNYGGKTTSLVTMVSPQGKRAFMLAVFDLASKHSSLERIL